MDVSIVIRTKNEAEFIEKTLRKVEEQEFDGKCEIIVVDSGSTDSTVDIVKRHNVSLIEIAQEEFSYGRSLNIGASAAMGRFVVNLSAHALPRDTEWLTNLIKGFENDNMAGTYGRQLADGHVNPFEARLCDDFFGLEKIRFDIDDKETLKRIRFSNSNCAVRRDVWQRFNFDEHVPYGEDILWQTQVIKAGFSILYEPDAVVYHTHRVNIRNAFKDSRGCAYTLALIEAKRQSIPVVAYDFAIFLGMLPKCIYQDLRYIWKNNYREYLWIALWWVIAVMFGWFMGRARYRLKA
jgi:rhamnosyltransferase